jgi:hypothetical protein
MYRSILYFFLICICYQSKAESVRTHSVVARIMPVLLEIIEHPKDVIVCEGQGAVFSVRVVGHVNPKYQWQSSINEVHWTDIKGANNETFNDLHNLSKVHDGLIVRVVITADNNPILISQTAKLRVEGSLICIKQPESQLVVEGGTLVLDAEFSSKGNTIYQWQYAPYGTGTWLDLVEAHEPQLKLQNLSLLHSGGSFRLLARGVGECGSAISNTAFLEVIEKPLIQLNRGQDSYCGGGSTTFTVKMKGATGREKVQWQESRDKGRTFRHITDATQLSYTISRILETMTGFKYRALITLPGGAEVITTEITIAVFGAVAFNEQPRSQLVCPADAFVLKARTDFKGSEPIYKWQISDDSIAFRDLPGGENGSFEVVLDFEDRATRYYRTVVHAGDCHSMISDVARVDVLSVDGIEPNVTDAHVDTAAQKAVIRSDFRADASVYACTWQWSANDGSTWQTINSPHADRLELTQLRKEDHSTYLYRVKVLNKICARIYYSQPARLLFE